MNRYLIGLLVSWCIGIPFSALADNIEVIPSNGNTCFPALNEPCTLESALGFAEVNPGDDIITLAAGIYDTSTFPLGYLYAPLSPIGKSGKLTLTGAGAIIDGGGLNPGMTIDTRLLDNDGTSDILIANITFRNGHSSSSDGAGLSVLTEEAGVTVHHCNFTDNVNENSGGEGGALEIEAGGAITLANNLFAKNYMQGPGGGAAVRGEDGSTVLILKNIFRENTAESPNSNQGIAGGGLVVGSEGDTTIDGNLFHNNLVLDGGGGAMVFEGEEGSVTLTDNIFSENTAISSVTDPFIDGGGAVFMLAEEGDLRMVNNTFFGNNVSNNNGGALKLFVEDEGTGSLVDLYNNIFWDNSATGSTCPGTCNDMYIDDDPEDIFIGAQVNVFNNLYSDISFKCQLSDGCLPHQNVDVATNLASDPMFADAFGGDFRLDPGSPAIDTGSAAAPDLPATDFQGSDRDQGLAPDMGALESAPASVPPSGPEHCANNVDDDGDLLIDCNDPDCMGAAACLDPVPPGSEHCANGSDDDGDGLADCGDPECSGAVACLGDDGGTGSENCVNNTDDDGDGNIDCNDPDCSGASACAGVGGGGGTTVDVQGGCALNPRGSAGPLVWLVLPSLLAAIALIRRRKPAALTVLFLLTFLGLGIAHPVFAVDLEVTNNPDNDCNDNVCDLQAALILAGGNGEDDVLTLEGGTYDASPAEFGYIALENHSLTLTAGPFDQPVIDGGSVNRAMGISTTVVPDSTAHITIRGLTFQNGNSGITGGGLAVATNNANITIERCNFRNNNSSATGGPPAGGGGLTAFALEFGQVSLTDNFFYRNKSTKSFGGGSEAASINGNVLMEGNTYVQNSTLDINVSGVDTAGGGAVAVSIAGHVLVNRNTFIENSSLAGGGLVVAAVGGIGTVTNNVVARNLALGDPISTFDGGGGGIVVAAPTGTMNVTNNTIVDNQSGGDGGGLFLLYEDDRGEANIFNNIFQGNLGGPGAFCTQNCDDIVVLDDPDGNNVGARVNIAFNDVSPIFFQCNLDLGCEPQQNVDAATNINEDPLFAAVGLNNYRLLAGSPAIDAGSALAPGLPVKDFDLKPRNQGEAPDMGAFESAPPPVTPPDPPTAENCANGVDDDGDQNVDCNDPDCSGAAACQVGNPPAGPENCANNVDDDADGNIDCNDPDCNGVLACEDSQAPSAGTSENCANEVDDDSDGQVDCDDGDCSGAAACSENSGVTGDNVSVNSGCSLASGTTHASAWFLGLVPFLLAAAGIFRNKKSGHGR